MFFRKMDTFLGDNVEAIGLDSGIGTMATQEHGSIAPVDNSVTGKDCELIRIIFRFLPVKYWPSKIQAQ